MKKLLLLIIFTITISSFAQDTIPAIDSKNHLETLACVVGKVVSVKLAKEGKKVNYINIDGAYPNAVFTVVVTNEYLETSKIKLEDLRDKTIYVTGRITTYKNDEKQTPQIFNPRRIEIKM